MRDDYYPLDNLHADGSRANDRSNSRPRPRKRKQRRDWSIEKHRTLYLVLIWIFMIFLGLVIAFNIVVTALYYNSSSAEYDPSNADYPLYKNSRYKECASDASSATNCTLLVEGPANPGGIGNFIDDINYGVPVDASGIMGPAPLLTPSNHATWCALVGCLKEYTVLPSAARRSAIGYDNILTLAELLMVAISAAWAVQTYIAKGRHEVDNCPGFRYVTPVFIVYDICSTVLWWYSFTTIVMDRRNPAAISLIAWITTWRHTYDEQSCPTSCWLDKHPRYRKPLTIILIIAAAAHVVATCYIIPIVVQDFRRYDCLEPQTGMYAFSSKCSYQDVCAKDWLFSDPGARILQARNSTSMTLYIVVPMCIAGFTTFPVFFTLIDTMRGRNRRSWRGLYELWRANDHGPDTCLKAPYAPILAGFTIIVPFAILQIVMVVTGWNMYDHVATVAYDTQCLVAHVALSPWRGYLDVSDEGRILRIVTAWMNA
ncbi:hypothetical protein LTR17_017805 [Elasticomyces elasticus]|nr:hypothetical protein LTR17_017805 [Elasticomyces elasticus]